MRNVLIPRKTYRLAMRIIMILTVTLLIFTIRNLFVASMGIHHINSGIATCRDSLNSYYAEQGIYLAEDLNY